MDCRETRDRIPFLDRGDLDPGEREEVERHAGACAACAKELALTRESVDLLREGTSDLLADPPTAEELREMLGAEAPVIRWRRPFLRLAAAALVLVAAPVAWLALHAAPAEEPATGHAAEGETLDARFQAAMDILRTGRLAEAEAAFRAVAEACVTEADEKAFGARARLNVGECLYRQRKYIEAYEAYGEVVERFRELAPAVAADAAYYRYRAATALYAETKARPDGERKQEALDAFWREFPDHPRAIDLAYYRGADLITEGDAARLAGRADEAKKHYEAAIAVWLTMVKPTSLLYEKARARIGECLFKLERYDEALESFREILPPNEPVATTDPQRLTNRRTARALAFYYGARCLREKEDWEGVLGITAGFDRAPTDRETRLWVPPAKLERVRALVALGRLAAAEQEVGALTDDFETAEATSEACRILGRALLDAGGEEGEAKAADLLDFRLDHDAAATAEDFAEVARLHEKRGALDRAESRMETAVRMVTEELGRQDGATPRESARLLAHLRTLQDGLERIRAAKPR